MTEPDKIHIMHKGSNFSFCGRYFPYYQTHQLNSVDCFVCQDTLKFLDIWGKVYPGYSNVKFNTILPDAEYDIYSRSFLRDNLDSGILFEGIVQSRSWKHPKNSDPLLITTLVNVTVGHTIVAEHVHVVAPSFWWYATDIGYRVRFRGIPYKYMARPSRKGRPFEEKYGIKVYTGDPFYVLTTKATKLKGVGYYGVRAMGR